MKKLKVIQIGVTHEHATGKFPSLKLLPETFEILGYVSDLDIETPRFHTTLHPMFEPYPCYTLEEALSVPDLDCAVIEVPNLELVRIGKMCAERKIPMHLDKPAGESLEPYGELLEICRKNNVPLQMGYMYRGNPALQFLRELIRGKVIGEICEAELDMNHGYGGETYKEYIGKFRGGIMFNLGCHLIDFVIAAMGTPEKITPFLRSAPGVDPRIKNNCFAVMEYPHGFVKLHACHSDAGDTSCRRWSFSGTNGHVWVLPPERFDGKEVVINLTLKKGTGCYPAGRHEFRFPPQRDRYMEQLVEFARIVRGEMANPYTYEHDFLVHKATLAASGYMEWK